MPRIREIRLFDTRFHIRALQRWTACCQVEDQSFSVLGVYSLKLSANDWQLIYDAGQGSWSFWSYQRSGRRARNADSRGDRRKASPVDTALTCGKPLLVTVPFHPFVTLWLLFTSYTFAVLHRCFCLETGIVSASSNLCLLNQYFLEILKSKMKFILFTFYLSILFIFYISIVYFFYW